MADSQLTVEVRGVDKLSPVLKHMESGVIRFVGAVSAALATITTFAMPVLRAAEFEKAMLEVRKTTNFGAQGIKYLGDEILTLSSRINVVAPELARIAAMGGQLGLASRSGTKGLLAFTEEVAKAVTALDISADEVAESLGKLINIFDIPETDYSKVLSTIARVNLESTASARELFDILRRIGNLGGAVRVDQASALAGLAVDIGFTSETAATSMVKIFSSMRTEASKFAQFMGVTVDEWVQPLVNGRGIEQLKKYLQRLNEIPEEQAARAIEELSGGGRIGSLMDKLRQQMKKGEDSHLDRLLAIAADEMERGTAAGNAQAGVLAGLGAQWQILGNRISATFTRASAEALPALTNLVIKLGDSLANPDTVAQFSAVMSNLARVADFLAGALDRVGGAASALRGLFDIGFLLLFTKGFAGLRAGFNNFVDTATAKSAQFVEAEQAMAASIQATNAVIAARAKAYAAQQKLNAARVETKTADINYAATAREQKLLEDAKTRVIDAEVQKRRNTLAKNLQEQRALESVNRQNMSQLSDQWLQARSVVEAKHEKQLSKISGAGSESRKAKKREQQQAELAELDKHHNDVIAKWEAHYKALARTQQQAIAISRLNLAGASAAVKQDALEKATAANLAAGAVSGQKRSAAIAAAAGVAAATANVQALEKAADEARAALDAVHASANAAAGKVTASYAQSKNAVVLWLREKQLAFARWVEAAQSSSGLVQRALHSATNAGFLNMGLLSTRTAAVVTKSLAGIAAAAYTTGVAFKNLTLSMLGVLGGAHAIDTVSARLAVLNAQIAAGAVGIGLWSLRAQKAAAVVGGAFRILGGIFNRLLLAYVAIDLGKWALEAVGLLEPVYKMLNKMVVLVNKLGLDIPKLQLPSEQKESARKFEEEKKQLDEATAAAEAFQQRVGKIQIGVPGAVGDAAFRKSLDERAKAMSSFAKETRDGMQYSLESAGAVQKAFETASKYLGQAADEIEHLRLRQQAYREELAKLEQAEPLADRRREMLIAQKQTLESRGATDSSAYAKASKELQEITQHLGRRAELETDINNISEAILVTDVKRAEIYKSLAEGLDPSYVADVLDSGLIDQLIAAQKQFEKAKEDLAKTPAVGGASDENSKYMADHKKNLELVAQSEAQIDTLQQQLYKTPSIAAISGSKTAAEMAKMVTALGNAQTQVKAFGVTTDAAGKRVTTSFKAVGSAVVVTAKTYQSTLLEYLSNKEVARLYKAQADAARASAVRAQGDISRLYDKAKKDMEEMAEFAEKIAGIIRKTQDAVSLSKAKRAENAQKAADHSFVDELLTEKERYIQDLEAAAKTEAYLEERARRERAAFEEEKRQRHEAVDDKYALKEEERAQAQRIKQIEDGISRLAELRNRLDEINAVLQDPGASKQQKLDLVPEWEKTQKTATALTADIKELMTAAASAGTEIKALADPAKLEVLSVLLTRAVSGINNTAAQGQEKVADVLSAQANAFDTQAKSAQDRVDQLGKSLFNFAKDSKVVYQEVSEDLAVAAERMQEPMAKLRQELELVGNTKILSAEHANEVKKRIDDIKTQVATISDVTIEFKNYNLSPLATSFTSQFNEAFDQIQRNLKATSVNVKVDPLQAQAAATEAFKGVKVDVQANVVPPANSTTPSNAGGAPLYKAAGGPVWGAGTSTGDKIKAYLSHGEYVVDALTTRMFGYGFFAYLQKMAKAGTPKLAVRAVLPGFAKGGPVGGKVVGISPTVYKVVTSITEGAGVAGGFNQPMSLTIPDIGTVPVITTEDVAVQLARQISIASLKRGSRKQRANT